MREGKKFSKCKACLNETYSRTVLGRTETVKSSPKGTEGGIPLTHQPTDLP